MERETYCSKHDEATMLSLHKDGLLLAGRLDAFEADTGVTRRDN